MMQGIPAPQNSLPYYNDAQSTVPSTFSENLALQSNVAKTEEGQPPHPLMMSESKLIGSYWFFFSGGDMFVIRLLLCGVWGKRVDAAMWKSETAVVLIR